MSKRALCLFLNLLMTASFFIFSGVGAAAAAAEDTSAPVTAPTAAAPQAASGVTGMTGMTEPHSAVPEATYSKAKFPVLTVAAISNYFGRIDAEYNEFTREITVTYMLKSSKRLLSTDWTLTYDASILTLDAKKNTLETICPIMKNVALMSVDGKKGVIRYTATDLGMFDYTTAEAAFVHLVFDVPELTSEDSEITKVDLTVNDLVVTEPDPQTGQSMDGREIVLVANGKGLKNNLTKLVQTSKYTMITPSTFSEPTVKPATGDEPSTAAPTVVTTAPATKPTAPAPGKEKKESAPSPPVYTGTWYIALLILVILLICSVILFVMRKRDIYND